MGRHEPLRGGQEELGSIPGVWFLFPFSWGNSPAGETLLIALPGSRFLRSQRQALRTTSSPARNKGIRRRDRRREEEAWVSEGKSPPSAVLPAGPESPGWGPHCLGSGGVSRAGSHLERSPQPLLSSLGPRPTWGPQSIFT